MTSGPGTLFDRLVDIMRTLRSAEGCPWDREQTMKTLRPFVLEEAYEVIEAIESGDMQELKGELGDLLFEAVFLAQIASEEHVFAIDDSIQAIVDKLIRRHPHVFGDQSGGPARPATATEVVERWEVLKARERTASVHASTLLSGIPATLPSLLRAYEIGARVAAVGFDWPTAANVVDKIDEEAAELRETVARGEGADRLEEEAGDLLFAIANLFRKLRIEPEAALRRANAKFTRRFDAMQIAAEARGQSLDRLTLDELEAEWQRVKRTDGD